MRSPWQIGVGHRMSLHGFSRLKYQSMFPVFASTATAPSCVIWMYCLTPPIVATIGEEYVTRSLTSLLRHRTLPVFLSSAANNPCGPPGTHTSCSPSTNGDHVKPQPRFFGPPPMSLTCASSSLGRSLRQRSLPPVSTQSRSPWLPSAKINSPSTVGVALG